MPASMLCISTPSLMDCSVMVKLSPTGPVMGRLLCHAAAITNAAKYSPPGTHIDLIVEALPSLNLLKVSVIDNGIGIPKEDLKHIFGRTYTVSSARTPNSTTGSGLGLSIVKAIIERHNGTVGCESIEGKGSQFFFTLPIVK